MYNEKVFEHYRNPKNVGEIENADGVGIYLSDFCGDITKFWMKIEKGKIKDVKYKTQGCVASVACGSALTELAKNRSIKEALKITKEDILTVLGGLPEPKIHCSMLAIDAFRDALYHYLIKTKLPVPQDLADNHEKIRPLLEEMKKKGYVLI